MQEKSVYDDSYGNKQATASAAISSEFFAAAMNLTSGKSTIK